MESGVLRPATNRVAHVGRVGVGDDGRERAVVVQEHDDLLPLGRGSDLLELAQRRRVLPLLRQIKEPKI